MTNKVTTYEEIQRALKDGVITETEHQEMLQEFWESHGTRCFWDLAIEADKRSLNEAEYYGEVYKRRELLTQFGKHVDNK